MFFPFQRSLWGGRVGIMRQRILTDLKDCREKGGVVQVSVARVTIRTGIRMCTYRSLFCGHHICSVALTTCQDTHKDRQSLQVPEKSEKPYNIVYKVMVMVLFTTIGSTQGAGRASVGQFAGINIL